MNDQAAAIVSGTAKVVSCSTVAYGHQSGAGIPFVEKRLLDEARSTIDAQAATIAELQGLLTSTTAPALEAIRSLALRKSCELGRELGVSIDDALELGVISARVLRMAETSAAIANAA